MENHELDCVTEIRYLGVSRWFALLTFEAVSRLFDFDKAINALKKGTIGGMVFMFYVVCYRL